MYKLTNTSHIIRTTDNATIPDDPGNRDYQDYLDWVAANNTPTPFDTRTSLQVLTDAKLIQIQAITQACGAQIVSGFTSSALGAAHTYPSQLFDQINLIGSVTSGLATIDFWCADNTNTWNIVAHTLAQIKQVLADAATIRMSYSTKLKTLTDNINAATTVADVQAVIW